MANSIRSSRFSQNFGAIAPSRWAVSAFVAIAGGGLALALATSGIYRSRQPLLALRAMPMEANALAAQADQIYFTSPEEPHISGMKMARRALVQQPANPKALRILGYYAGSNGQPERATKLAKLSEQLSRREAGAQLWLIENAAQSGSIAETLRHYDILLRTKPDSSMLLFQRLTQAIEDASIRKAMIPYLRSGTSWTFSFVDHAITNGQDLPSLVSLFVESKTLAKNEDVRMQAVRLLGRLTAEKQFAQAQRLYLAMPGASQGRLTNPAFVASDMRAGFGTMGWTLTDDPNAGAAFDVADKKRGPTLSVYANPSTTRPAASRLLYLRPGTYQFSATLSQIKKAVGGSLRWQMRCATSGNTVWTQDSTSGTVTSTISVPADCSVQYLDLVVSGGTSQSGMEATVSRVAISP